MAGWKWGEKEKCTCAACNKDFLIAPSMVLKKNYCSRECRNSSKILCICQTCGKEVLKGRTAARINFFCSPECKKASRTGICSYCGKEFERIASDLKGKEKTYCSRECMYKDISKENNCTCGYCGRKYYAHHINTRSKNYCCEACKAEGKKAEAEAQKNCVCDFCGKRFKRMPHDIKGKKKLYCSRECLYKGIEKDKQERKIYAVCMYCGKEFEGRSYCPNNFCSSYCTGKYYAEKRREETREERERVAEAKRKIKKQKQEMIAELKRGIKELKARQKEIKKYKACKCCGKIFKSNRPSYCSDECARRIDNMRRDKRIAQNGKPDLSINLFSLYKRDSGVCKLCGKLTNFTADIQADEYPSIDHIIPLSKGGKHEWNNVQLTHRKCNTVKSNHMPPGQLVSEG